MTPAKGQPTLFDCTPPAPAEWPRLSTSLRGPLDPRACQSCGSRDDVARWREHDSADRPEHVVVVLCSVCSRRLIDRHPRLYARLDGDDPWPGCMGICVGCLWRNGVRCEHADARANGGPGLKFTFAVPPTRAHLSGTRNGRRSSWIHVLYAGPATGCEGREQCRYYPSDGGAR